ncbi:hypothetical protein AK812_SmicGene20131 [Symbiodinium microadriaticum]|uniref:Uncharacterized protein n=1 Tax=Symbiodinium microadriaticum TaxID=2951 RepID=A0A1Q9DQU1_SYMMI|nr:hypothetical protein AK812_SmicGene20131 [Symbiodinium microadriaticum]CAE7444643.1 unnamed protein product [Symbiodinium microadriaticum]
MKAFAPSEQFQKLLAAQLEDSFLRQAEQFEKDGLLILPSYFQGCLEKWRGWYQHTMERVGSSQPTLHMQTFTATSHTNVELSNDVQAAVADPYLLALLAYVAGGNIQLSDFRAATTHPGEDILFRAWKWHRDGGKEPEWKLMVLLDDVAPGGNETHYLKGSMRRWKGSRQKDANFSMEDALHIASGGSKELPRITRCFGPAGTVILFAGQGLHRATHSKLAQRRVVTFRFKRNVPQLARIYPLDVVKQDQLCSSNTLVRSILVRGSGELLASSEECRFIDEKSSKQKLVQCEQDTSPQETACLLDAYEEMKTLSDLKPRVHSAELAELHSKLLEIFSVDINFDLDLPVRQNNLDVSRDLLRVRFRYLRSGSEQFVDLLKNFHSCADEGLHEPASVSTLQLLAGRLEDWLKSCSSESAELKREAVACQRLTMDVGRALAHLDDVQDLRTVLCFLYLLHDHVRRVFPGCPSWVALDQRILLSTYSFVVLLDDAAASSPADNARGMSHIPNHTRQYLFRAKAHQKTCQPIQVPSFVQKSAAAGG